MKSNESNNKVSFLVFPFKKIKIFELRKWLLKFVTLDVRLFGLEEEYLIIT